MSVWKRYKKKVIRPGEKDYNKGTWQAQGEYKGIPYKKSLPLATTKKDAEDFELEIKKKIDDGEWETVKKNTKFSDYVNDIYLPRVSQHNKSFGLNKKYQIQRLLKFFGKYRLRQITRILVENFRDQRKKEKIVCQRCQKHKITCYLCSGENPRYKTSPCWKCKKRIELFKIHKLGCKPKIVEPSTVNRELVTLSDILTDAAIDREVKENPMKHVSYLPEAEASDRILTDAEKDRLFPLLNAKNVTLRRYRMKMIIFIALTTGWREGRIMAIRKEDLNFANRTVNVIASKQDESKAVRVSEFTWGILTSLANSVESGCLFRNLSNGEPLKKFPYDDWWELLKEAKIKNLTFHNLRATVGTERVLDGDSLFEVQNMLGHKRITTTQKYIRIAEKVIANNLEQQGEKYREFMK